MNYDFSYLCHFVIFTGWRARGLMVYHFSSLNLLTHLVFFSFADSRSYFSFVFPVFTSLSKKYRYLAIFLITMDSHSHLISSTSTLLQEVSFVFHISRVILNANSMNSNDKLNYEKAIINDVFIKENHIYFRLMLSSRI